MHLSYFVADESFHQVSESESFVVNAALQIRVAELEHFFNEFIVALPTQC
jgi:hypothetical protein